MAEITLAQAQAKLTEWMNADTVVATGQSYSIGERSLTRANSKEIRENIKFWKNEVRRATLGGSIKMRRAVPRDL